MTLQLLPLIALVLLPGRGDDVPRIKEQSGKYSIRLPSQMRATLRNYDPAFVCWQLDEYDSWIRQTYEPNPHQLPYAVIGDFNDDGTEDVILHGHDRENEILLAILSLDATYRVTELRRSKYSDSAFKPIPDLLTYVAKGTTVHSFDLQDSLKLTADAFKWAVEKGSSVWYFQNGKFVQFITGD